MKYLLQMWAEQCKGDNQIHIVPRVDRIIPINLLEIPKGGVTIIGLK